MPGTCHQVGGLSALGSTVMENSRSKGFVGSIVDASEETMGEREVNRIHNPPIHVLLSEFVRAIGFFIGKFFQVHFSVVRRSGIVWKISFMG